MTQEEKQLLIKDLCARLPYGVKVKYLPDNRFNGIVLPYIYNDVTILQKGHLSYRAHIKNIKPYLRPMSSMTAEEQEEYKQFLNDIDGYAYSIDCVPQIDWLNAHYFDYRGLIEKGLALVAPEEMYKLNN